MVVRCVLRLSCKCVIGSKSGVILRFIGEYQVLDYLDEGNSQHASDADQDGLHLFKSLTG